MKYDAQWNLCTVTTALTGGLPITGYESKMGLQLINPPVNTGHLAITATLLGPKGDHCRQVPQYYHVTFMYYDEEYVLTRSVYQPGVCTNQVCVLTRSAYQPGVCTNQECVLTRSAYQPGVCTNQECVLTRSVY